MDGWMKHGARNYDLSSALFIRMQDRVPMPSER